MFGSASLADFLWQSGGDDPKRGGESGHRDAKCL
jgi:hypothetical protein